MSNTVNLRSKDGKPYCFIDKIIGSGGMKDVYFAPDKSYVVAFFAAFAHYRKFNF